MNGYVRRIILTAITGIGLLLPAANAAAADPVTVQHSGCNFATCIRSESYPAGLYVAQAYMVQGAHGYGHYHVWGPGLDRNTETKWWHGNDLTPRFPGGGVGNVCAQFWHHNDDGTFSPGWGLPCVPTH